MQVVFLVEVAIGYYANSSWDIVQGNQKGMFNVDPEKSCVH